MRDNTFTTPPGGYSPDYDEAEEEEKRQAWADWALDAAIDEARLRRKE